MTNKYLLIPVAFFLLLLFCTTASAVYITTIDFNSSAGVDKWFYEKAAEGEDPPATGPDILGEAPIASYGGINRSDTLWETQPITKGYYATHHSKFNINPTGLINFTAHWEGYGSETDSKLYIWNFASSSWELIETGASTAPDNIITKLFTTGLNNYINASGHLHLVATSFNAAGGPDSLYTNYVKIDAYYLSLPTVEKPRTYNATMEKPYFKNEDVIIRVNATHGDFNLTNATITIRNAAGSIMVDTAVMNIEDTLPNGFTYGYTYTLPPDASGNGWKVEVDVNHDAGPSISNKTIFHISTRPGYNWTGFPLETTKSGTINGGVYIYGRGTFYDKPSNRIVTVNFTVPNGTIQWAHFYYSIFGGNPCATGWIDLTWTNATSQTEITQFIGPYDTCECQGLIRTSGKDVNQDDHAGVNDHHEYNWGTTCGKWTGYFDVTDIVTSGANTANTNTVVGYSGSCDNLDGRQYGAILVVVYEGGDNPKEIDYWINEGSMGFNYGPYEIECIEDIPPYQNDSIYFDGTIGGSISRANYTGMWLTAHPNSNHVLKFNDQEVLDDSGNNISTITENPFFLHTWNVTDKISTTSGNNAWFDLGNNGYVSWSFSALVVEKTGTGVPDVSVTVNNASFSTVVAGSTNEIPISLTLNNTGNASALIKAVFTTSNGTVYGLNGTSPNIIPGNNFKLGPNGNEKFLTSTTIETSICTLGAGQTLHYDAILIVPPGQTADDYTGTIQLSW